MVPLEQQDYTKFMYLLIKLLKSLVLTSNNVAGMHMLTHNVICFTGNLPVIIEDPISKLIGLGSNFTNASLTCEANGTSGYSWERQSGSITSDAIGVNTNTLTLINLRLEDAGKYRCVATNGSGSTQSDYATLTIKGMQVMVRIAH